MNYCTKCWVHFNIIKMAKMLYEMVMATPFCISHQHNNRNKWVFSLFHILKCQSVFFFYVWFISVDLICFSLITNDARQFFNMLIFHSYIFFREMSDQFVCPFLIRLFVFLLDYERSFFPYKSTSSNINFAKHFYHH